MKKFFTNPIVKAILCFFLPFFISLPLAFRPKMEIVTFVLLIIIGFVLNFCMVLGYAIYEYKDRRKTSEINNTIPLFSEYSLIVLENANKLYNLMGDFKKYSDIREWRFIEKQGDDICRSMLSFIKNVAVNGKEFSVSIVFKSKENNNNGYYMSSRKAHLVGLYFFWKKSILFKTAENVSFNVIKHYGNIFTKPKGFSYIVVVFF